MKNPDFWKPIFISLVITPLALLLAVVSGGSGHGDYFWAKIFFPYTMLSVLLFESITFPFVLLAIVQFPLYGLALAFASQRKKLYFAAIGLFAAHVLAVMMCIYLIDSNFS